MRAAILGAILAILTSACAQGGGASSAPAPGAPDIPLPHLEQAPSSDVITDIAMCAGPTPEYTWLFSSAWSAKFKLADGSTLERVMTFTQSDLSVKETNYIDGVPTESNSKSQIQWNDEQFTMLDANGAAVSEVKYSFVGPCLKIDNAGSELVLVPVEDDEE